MLYVSLGPFRTCIPASMGEVEILGRRSRSVDSEGCVKAFVFIVDGRRVGRRGARRDIERAWRVLGGC